MIIDITTRTNASALTLGGAKALPYQSVYRKIESVLELSNTTLIVDYDTIGIISEINTNLLRANAVEIIYM
jgi:hypothetical protein